MGSAAQDRERFVNLKAERYWYLRERFQRGEVSGLNDEMLAELASISYLIDSHGKTAIEDKASVKSTLGRSPDLAESLMLALGEITYEPFVYRPIGNSFTFHHSTPGTSRLTQREKDAREDAQNDLERRMRIFGGGIWGQRGRGW